MSSAIVGNPLETFELLPPAYRLRHRTTQAVAFWTMVLTLLSIVMCGTAAVVWMQRHTQAQAQSQLVAAAMPLMQLRSEVLRLEQQKRMRQQQLTLTQSVQPDDSLLQSMAAIAAAAASDPPTILIDSVQIRLPIEYPADLPAAPSWAVPNVAIAARVLDPDATSLWFEKLQASDRLESVNIVSQSSLSSDADHGARQVGRVQLTAVPRATKVLP